MVGTIVERFKNKAEREERYAILKKRGTKHLIRSTTTVVDWKTNAKGRREGHMLWLLARPAK